MYEAIVKEYFEYCMRACVLSLKNDVAYLEMVYPSDTRMVKKQVGEAHTRRLEDLDLHSTEEHYARGDMIEMFNMSRSLPGAWRIGQASCWG